VLTWRYATKPNWFYSNRVDKKSHVNTVKCELFIPRISVQKTIGIAIKANLTKVSAAKPRVLASYATFDAPQDPKIAGLPQKGIGGS
jgi:hypothetical protein